MVEGGNNSCLTLIFAAQSASHQEVCSLKGDFEKAQKSVNDCFVNLGKTEKGHAMKYLRDFDFIERVKLCCKHFVKMPGG